MRSHTQILWLVIIRTCLPYSSDLNDGILLIQLLKKLSGKAVSTAYNADPQNEWQEKENVKMVFEFMETEGLSLINVGK